VKNKNQETDGYGRDKGPKTEKLKRKEKRYMKTSIREISPKRCQMSMEGRI